MFPLTLRAMNRTIPHARNSARPSFALLSVLALLALACFPVLAQAEESSGVQYETAVPTATGHTSPPKGGASGGTPAHSSATGGGSTTNGSSNTGNTGSGSPSGSSGNNNPSTAGNGNTGQAGQGNAPTGTGKTDAKADQKDGQPNNVTGTQASSDDSSSPLVPILIAVAVLAAISIAAVVIRQRRQGGGPGAQVSPKATSPKAS
jgi:hypothetical protein